MSTIAEDMENVSPNAHRYRDTSLRAWERRFREANKGKEPVIEVWESVHTSAKMGDMKAATIYLNSKFGLQKAVDDSKKDNEKKNPISNEIKDKLARAIDSNIELEIISS